MRNERNAMQTTHKIARDSLLSLESYAKVRKEFRSKVMAHKRDRTIHLGAHLTLIFEDMLTIRYQVQEMLRIERTFEEEGIQDELDAYNPLIPDGRNLKATMMIEYADEAERKQALTQFKGIEDRVWVQVDGSARVYAVADEDLERENEEKTSAVHFLRFDLDDDMARSFKSGAGLALGVDHRNYQAEVRAVAAATHASLAQDLD